MAYYPKYNKRQGKPKAFIGAAVALAPAVIEGVKGISNLVKGSKRAKASKSALEDFDTESLQLRKSKSLQKLVNQPISQEYIEGLEESRASDTASAMSALSRDPRNTLAGVAGLGRQASKERLALLGMQDKAKTSALTALAKEEDKIDKNRAGLAAQELKGIKGEVVAAEKKKMAGIDGIGGALMSGLGTANNLWGNSGNNSSTGSRKYTQEQMDELKRVEDEFTINKDGGKIAEDGGVTPGEFDHDTNPIDLVQDGEKIGEATGGELILPPDDVQAIEEALNSEDKDAAFELMKELVAKYKDNEMSQNEAPQEAQEGGYLGKVKSRMGSLLKSSIKY